MLILFLILSRHRSRLSSCTQVFPCRVIGFVSTSSRQTCHATFKPQLDCLYKKEQATKAADIDTFHSKVGISSSLGWKPNYNADRISNPTWMVRESAEPRDLCGVITKTVLCEKSER